jgi:hypothetical protein
VWWVSRVLSPAAASNPHAAGLPSIEEGRVTSHREAGELPSEIPRLIRKEIGHRQAVPE